MSHVENSNISDKEKYNELSYDFLKQSFYFYLFSIKILLVDSIISNIILFYLIWPISGIISNQKMTQIYMKVKLVICNAIQ